MPARTSTLYQTDRRAGQRRNSRGRVDGGGGGPYVEFFSVNDRIPHTDWGQEFMVRKKLGRGRKNRCRFCTKEGCPRPAFVDYKDVQTLKKLCTSQGKLFSRKRSGNCAAFQRAVKDAVKRARFMALMPYVGE
jgi:small subunit ribosomal protein S18